MAMDDLHHRFIGHLARLSVHLKNGLQGCEVRDRCWVLCLWTDDDDANIRKNRLFWFGHSIVLVPPPPLGEDHYLQIDKLTLYAHEWISLVSSINTLTESVTFANFKQQLPVIWGNRLACNWIFNQLLNARWKYHKQAHFHGVFYYPYNLSWYNCCEELPRNTLGSELLTCVFIIKTLLMMMMIVL